MLTLEELFDSKILRVSCGCWIWTGATMPNGYGVSQSRRRAGSRLAHRIAYERGRGPIPAGLTIDHLCRVRSCVNPVHLEAVTARTNNLRGIGPAAVHAKKTHCPRGHEYAGPNLHVTPGGERKCRRCHADRERERRARAHAGR